MKLVHKVTREVLGEITTNRSMTLEEACDQLEIYLNVTQEDCEECRGQFAEDLEMIW